MRGSRQDRLVNVGHQPADQGKGERAGRSAVRPQQASSRSEGRGRALLEHARQTPALPDASAPVARGKLVSSRLIVGAAAAPTALASYPHAGLKRLLPQTSIWASSLRTAVHPVPGRPF